MVEDSYLGSKKIAVIFKKQDQEQAQFVKGRNAQTLLWLVHKGEGGVTAAEVSSWALRLAHYVFELRRKHGLRIETVREPHDGGNHARYVLREPVEIAETIPRPEKE